MKTTVAEMHPRLQGLECAEFHSRSLVSKVFETLVLWNQRAVTRYKLREMSPQNLHRMGITLEQAIEESEKPFWRN